MITARARSVNDRFMNKIEQQCQLSQISVYLVCFCRSFVICARGGDSLFFPTIVTLIAFLLGYPAVRLEACISHSSGGPIGPPLLIYLVARSSLTAFGAAYDRPTRISAQPRQRNRRIGSSPAQTM